MENRIDGHTGLLALFGTPVGHFGSPAMCCVIILADRHVCAIVFVPRVHEDDIGMFV